MPGNPPNPKFEDILTDRMRAHLGVSHRQNRPGGAFGVHKKPQHRPWNGGGPVETVYVNGAQPEGHNRRDEAERQAREERLAREQLERQLREKEAARIALETRLGHEAMARREAEAARREAEARLQASPEVAPADAAVAPRPAAKPPQPAPQAKRAYVRHKPLKERPPVYDHPKPPSGRPKGFMPLTKTFDYSRFPSTETPWVFIDQAERQAAGEPPPAPTPPPPPKPPQRPEPVPAAAKQRRTGRWPRPVAWWKPGWREKLSGRADVGEP